MKFLVVSGIIFLGLLIAYFIKKKVNAIESDTKDPVLPLDLLDKIEPLQLKLLKKNTAFSVKNQYNLQELNIEKRYMILFYQYENSLIDKVYFDSQLNEILSKVDIESLKADTHLE